MVKINQFEIENVKRVKAVRCEPSADGLTVIGGRNGQGKTSVLDAIAWALGGAKFAPSAPRREGSAANPRLKVTLSNGLIVERAGKNAALKVTDPKGAKGGQKLLDELIESLALDLPRFMSASGAEKCKTLLSIIGVESELAALEQEEGALYNRRTEVGRIADQKKHFAEEMAYYPDCPKEPVSASELIRQQQEILARNGENQRKREQLHTLEANLEGYQQRKAMLEEELAKVAAALTATEADLETARKSAEELRDESTEELEKSIAEVDELNARIRTNLDREKAELDAEDYARQYNELTVQIEAVREKRQALLEHADLPLPELSVEGGELVYKGQKWDGMSGSEQLKVATAIVRRLKPECGFVLMDKLEQMDLGTLQEFGAWAEAEGLQIIATRVSTGDECSIIIEDGYVAREEPAKAWKAGSF